MPDRVDFEPRPPPSSGGIVPVSEGGTGADLSNAAQARVLATPPNASGPIALRSLTAPYLPAVSPSPAGSYTNMSAEVDQYGRVISASSGAPSAHADSHRAGGSDALLSAPGAIGGGTPAAITGTVVTATSGFVGDGSGLTGLPSGGGGDAVTTLVDGATITSGGRYYLPPGAACTLDIADGVYVWLAVGGSGIILPNTAGPWRVLGGGDAGSSLFVASPAVLECWRVSNRMMYSGA